MSAKSEQMLYYWVFQAAIVIIGVGWVCVEFLAGNAVAGLVSFLLVLTSSVFAFKAAAVRGRGPLSAQERIVVTVIASLLSIFSMVGILVNFTALFQSSDQSSDDSVSNPIHVRRIVYGGLGVSGLIFILASHWPSALHLRALIAVSLILVTASLAIGISGRRGGREYNPGVE